jgi:hypothetical protein
MAVISKFIISSAKPIDLSNWLTVQDGFGPKDVPDSSPRGDCVVVAYTLPQNNEGEWSQITWTGGDAVQGKPNQCRVKRNDTGATVITASIGSSIQTCVLWTMWADVTVLTTGPRPRRARAWSEGEFVRGPDQCGAFETDAMTMGKNARGQIVAVAKMSPKGVGRMLLFAGKQKLLNLRREVSAVYYVDGALSKEQSSVDWKDDESQPLMRVVDSADIDEVYDTDGPDLAAATQTSETYANFRQWLEWDGQPCSNHALWYFQARWKNQEITLKDVGQGSISLPHQPFYKRP